MNQSYSNFLTMVQAVLASMKKDQEAWSNEQEIITEIAAIETDFKAAKAIDDALSGMDAKAYTNASNQEYEIIVSLTLKLCKKLCVSARRNNDPALLLLANHSQSSITAGKRKEIISRCTAIINKAESMFEALQVYKVTEKEITAIRQHIESFDVHTDERSNIKTDKTTLTQLNLPDLIQSIRQRFVILDDMIEGFLDDEDVIARYKQSRVVVNYGKMKTAKNKSSETGSTVSSK